MPSSRIRARLSTAVRYLRYRRRARQAILWLAVGIGVLAIGWLTVTALLVRQQSAAVSQKLATIQILVADGHTAQAQNLAGSLRDDAQHVHQLTTGPVWWASAHLPYVGRPLEVARVTTATAATISGRPLSELLTIAIDLESPRLRIGPSSVRLSSLVQARPGLAAASRALASASRRVAALPSSTWLSTVDARRAVYAQRLDEVASTVAAADRAARILPDMLGQHGTKRYFIGLQNEAEMRGTGGLPGAFAIATASNGTLRFTRFLSDAALLPTASGALVPTSLDFGTDYRTAFGASQPTSSFVDSNVSPHFPYAARIWAAMYQKVFGERIDGAIAVDPTTLSYFLAATGATSDAFGVQVNSANVVNLTERDEYALFPDDAKRTKFLVSVLKGVAEKLTSGAGRPVDVVRAASRASAQQRLQVWSADPTVEHVLQQTGYGAAVPQTDVPFGAAIVNNAAAGKLDYYLTRSLDYQRTGCGSRRDVLATVSLRNGAPAVGLPPLVTTRFDHPPPGARAGDNRVILDYYATAGALLRGVTVNGKAGTAAVLISLGHPIVRLDLELPRGTTTTVTLHLTEPAGKGAPVIWRQPGVTPLAVQSFNQSC